MFPPAGAEIYTNEDGEVLGWDAPADPSDFYCADCGFGHGGPCPEPDYGDDEEDGDIARQNAEDEAADLAGDNSGFHDLTMAHQERLAREDVDNDEEAAAALAKYERDEADRERQEVADLLAQREADAMQDDEPTA